MGSALLCWPALGSLDRGRKKDVQVQVSEKGERADKAYKYTCVLLHKTVNKAQQLHLSKSWIKFSSCYSLYFCIALQKNFYVRSTSPDIFPCP